MGVLLCMDGNGDTQLATWTPEVTEADLASINAMLDRELKSGKTAFSMKGNGTGEQISKITGTENEVILVPQIVGG